MYRTISSLAVAAALVLPLSAADPVPPPGGYPVQTLGSQAVTFSDGHVSLMDLYYPDVVPPATGWPAVLVNHGSGGDRTLLDIQRVGNYLAAAGYVVYAFDLRGNVAGNTPERELLDQAEAHGLADAILPARIDVSRLAVTGFSGGGQKSFWAAAWSGKPLPLAGYVASYPPVRAVAPEITNLAQEEVVAPGGVLAADYMAKGQADPAIFAALLAEDYVTYSQLVQQPFFDDTFDELMLADVPILGMWAAQDTKITNNPSLDLFAALPMTKRLHLSTGGHSTVKTTHERDLQQEMRRRWFDRFLKDIQNGVELEPYAEIGVQPRSDAEHADLAEVWEHRNEDQWPPATPPTRLYLRGTGELSPTAPSVSETGPVIQHRVAPGFDLIGYGINGFGLAPGAQMLSIPDVGGAFDGPVLLEDTELVGRTRVFVNVNDSTGVFQLSAKLVHVAPDGTEHWISMGTAGERAGSSGVYTMTIELDDVAQVVPAGHLLRLRLQNLADHDPPGTGRRIRVLPYFTDTNTQVRMEPNALSGLDLPLRDYRANMRPRLATVSSTALSHTMDLRGGAAKAGLAYVLLASATGEAPGITLPGLPNIPVNLDEWTLASIQSPNSVLFPMSVGVLDSDGRAAPGFAIPAPVGLAFAGYRFNFTTLILDGVVLDAVTGATTLLVDP